MKRDIDNRERVLESTKDVTPIVQKCHELKTGPDFLPTLTILFRPSPSHTL